MQGRKGSHQGPLHIPYPRPWLRLPATGREGTVRRAGWRARPQAPVLPPACFAVARTALSLLGLCRPVCALGELGEAGGVPFLGAERC